MSLGSRSTKRSITQREEVGETDEECSDLDETRMPAANKPYGLVGKQKASAGCGAVVECFKRVYAVLFLPIIR